MLNAIISTLGALVGCIVGASVSYAVGTRMYRVERARLISSWSKSAETEKARVAAYRKLWASLGGISTHNPHIIVSTLPDAQRRLHEWYYQGGGGLLLTGSIEQKDSPKAQFFAARDLQSADPYEIWSVFHRLRHSIRCDVGIYESEADENAALEHAKKQFKSYGS